MADIDLHKEYNPSGESVQDLFDRAEEGFFVPLYQREYTWEEENINQLFDDLILGVSELSTNENTTTFLGTVILTTLRNKKQAVNEGRAQPTAVQTVIDGQQRISTLALISIQITVKLETLLTSLPNRRPYSDIKEAGNVFIERLRRLYSIELRRGAFPSQKPKIIRAREDHWAYKGDDNTYNSPVALYIAKYIRTNKVEEAFAALDSEGGARVRNNVRLIDEWLDAVCNAHIPNTNMYEQFPVGAKISSFQIQNCILGFANGKIKAVIEKMERITEQTDYFATAIYQLLLLTHYLLRRCGVNLLQPRHDEWGFDMFQALNATGTPLTVMETFLPQVMQAEHRATKNEWSQAPSFGPMDEVQRLFDATTTNEEKGRRTNDLFGTFALCYQGERLGNKFSEQRRWLTRVYEKESSSIEEKRDLLEKLARIANFFYFGWYMEETRVPNRINGFEQHPDGALASLLIRYLKDANSRLSVPILARFYSQAVNQETNLDEFVESAKACAAFFTLWRSANSTSGLDEIFRKYFRGSNASVAINAQNWRENPSPITAQGLKRYFLDTLVDRGIADERSWISASERFLLYTELKTICRFILFIAGHDRIPHKEKPGLTKAGRKGSCKLLELDRWLAKDYKSIEHVSPQRPPLGHDWDQNIYANDLVHQVGNLLLLPVDLNKFANNKNWEVKFLHYCHVGERDEERLIELRRKAQRKGIVLSKRAIDAFGEVEYNCAVEPVLSVEESGSWDESLIRNRTQQIKKLAWKKLFSWLQP